MIVFRAAHRRLRTLACVGLGLWCAPLPGAAAGLLRLFVAPESGPIERRAAAELTEAFGRIGSREVRQVGEAADADILLSTYGALPAALRGQLLVPAGPEGFTLVTLQQPGRPQIVVCGADPAGVLYGAYELLERYVATVVRSPVADLSFFVEPGAGAGIDPLGLALNVRQTPFYAWRGLHLDFIGLGTASLLGRDRQQPRDAELWQAWADWAARHRLNVLMAWPHPQASWWDFVPASVLPGASEFTPAELAAAIATRRQLLAYAGERGLATHLMTFFPGRPSAALLAAHPEFFQPGSAPVTSRFCFQVEGVGRAFVDVAGEMLATYPELTGLHLRRWSESYPCECERCRDRSGPLGQEILARLIERATTVRRDARFVLSGYADPDYVERLPDRVLSMVKWGNDWDPAPETGRSATFTRRYGSKDVVIDVALPAEESFPLGLVQHRQLEAGIREHAARPSDFTNLRGFCAGLGDSDFGFISELNYVVFARLLRDPLGTDVPVLVRAWLANRFGAAAAEDVFTSLDLQAEVWRAFFASEDRGGYAFLRLAPYANWARFGDLYVSYPAGDLRALDYISGRSSDELQATLQRLGGLLERQTRAHALVDGVGAGVPPHGRLAFTDYQQQTEAYLRYLESRRAVVLGLLALRQPDVAEARRRFAAAIAANERLHTLITTKPNNVGFGDAGEHNLATWERQRLLTGIAEENERLRWLLR